MKYKDTYRLKIQGWNKIYHANSNQKKAGVAALDVRARKVLKDKEENYILIKESVLQENITVLNVLCTEKQSIKIPEVETD